MVELWELCLPIIPALKVRNIFIQALFVLRPFRADFDRIDLPRVRPWAIVFRPVGA